MNYLRIFSLLSICLIIGCKTSSNISEEVILMQIKYHQVPCLGEGSPRMCLLVKQEGQIEWEYFYDVIEGFEYQQGIEYSINVQKRQLKEVADGSSIKYQLKEIVEQKQKFDPFTIPVQLDSINKYLSLDSLNQFSLVQQVPVLADSSLIATWDSLQHIGQRINGIFSIDKNNRLSLERFEIE